MLLPGVFNPVPRPGTASANLLMPQPTQPIPAQSGGFSWGNPLLMAGLGLLAGNRRSRTPTNPWASAMQGLQYSQQLQGQAEERDMRQKLYDLQLAKYNEPEKPEVREVNGALMERQGDGSWKEVVAANTEGQAPKMRERFDGTTVIQEEWDPKTMKWNKVGEGMRWQPESTRADADYWTQHSTPQGIVSINARTNEVRMLTDPDGKPLVKSSDDPGLQGRIASEKGRGDVSGRAEGEAEASLKDAVAGLPRAEALVGKLNGLAEKATYTVAGKTYDAVRRQSGMEPREAAQAAAEFDSTIKNEVFPLLKETLGTQFTENDRIAMEQMLADKDLSPQEKTAQLRAFLNSKLETIKTLQRRVGDNLEMIPGAPGAPAGGAVRWDDL